MSDRQFLSPGRSWHAQQRKQAQQEPEALLTIEKVRKLGSFSTPLAHSMCSASAAWYSKRQQGAGMYFTALRLLLHFIDSSSLRIINFTQD
jgi:hypothetical protein